MKLNKAFCLDKLGEKMFLIAWVNRNDRTDVGAVRTTALLKQLKNRGIYPTVIPLWSSSNTVVKLKWVFTTFCKLLSQPRQLVYISCSPYNHLLIVLLACVISHHKLIVDFRDAYSIDIKERNSPGNYIFARIVEILIYRFCHKFVVVTPGIRDRYKKIFGNDKKIIVVPNGHEISSEFLRKLSIEKKEDNFIRVIYPGMFLPYFTEEQAKKYIEQLKRELNNQKKEFEILFIGTDLGTKKLFKNDNHVKFIPNIDDNSRISYKETIDILNKADLVFMPIANDYGCATKIYDYLALGLPIFNFIKKENWLHQYIGERIVDSCKNLHRFKMDFEGKYHRDNQMKKLVDYICDEVKKIKDNSYCGG